jgi:hypothetical protein
MRGYGASQAMLRVVPAAVLVDAKKCLAQGQSVARAKLASADAVAIQVAPVRRREIMKNPDTVARDEASMTPRNGDVSENDITARAATDGQLVRFAAPI